MKIGILTGGGDTASLNAILHGAAFQTDYRGHQLVGFSRGWKGVLQPDTLYELHQDNTPAERGGTILRTSRTNLTEESIVTAVENIESKVDALIAIGGDDTLSVGTSLLNYLHIPVCFVTKTIDNDVGKNGDTFDQMVNYFTSGFASAALRAAQYAEELRTTAYSHDRIMFLETMGRTPGWLALAAYRGNPDFILIPESELDTDQFLSLLSERYSSQKNAIIVVAEGVRYKGTSNPIAVDPSARDAFDHAKLGGVAEILAQKVKEELSITNVNAVNPGYLYRSGAPCELDRFTGRQLGIAAVDTVISGDTGKVAVLQRYHHRLVSAVLPIDQVLERHDGRIIPRTVDSRFYDSETMNIAPLGKSYFSVLDKEKIADLPTEVFIG